MISPSIQAVMSLKIGRCDSCQNLFCETPKVRKLYPHEGCAEWSTPEAAAIKSLPLVVVEAIKE